MVEVLEGGWGGGKVWVGLKKVGDFQGSMGESGVGKEGQGKR